MDFKYEMGWILRWLHSELMACMMFLLQVPLTLHPPPKIWPTFRWTFYTDQKPAQFRTLIYNFSFFM